MLNGWDLYDPEREFARQEVNYFVVARELFKLGFLVFRDLLFTVFNFLKTILIFVQGFQKFINHLAEADSFMPLLRKTVG